MSRLEDSPDFDRELLAAVRALFEANPRLAKVIVLAADRTAMRANRTVRPQNALQMGEGHGFVMKVRLREDGHS